MKLSRVYRLEMLKLIKMKMTWVLFICLMLPVYYGISIALNGSNVVVRGYFDALMFASINWNMLMMTGVCEVIFGLIAARLLSYELERGQLRGILLHVCDRRKIYIAKTAALFSLVALFLLAFYLICLAVYYIFIADTPLGSGELYSGIFSLSDILMNGIYMIQIIIVICVVLLLGLYFKAFISLMMGIGFVTLLQVLLHFPGISLIVPGKLALMLAHSQIDDQSVMGIAGVWILVVCFFVVFSLFRFERIDVK